jgi:e3 binding domain
VALARAADEELLMAQKTTKSQRSGGRRGQNASSRNGKGSAQSGGDKRPALEAMRQDTDADREYRQYVRREEQDRAGPPDVLLDVPELKVDLIHFELDDLDAHVAVKAQVLNLVKLTVGVDVHLSRVKLDIKGVEAELVMKAHLEHVAALVDRLMTSLDRNPELVDGLSRAVSEIGQGAGEAVDETGDAAKDVGKGAEGALKDVGKGAGQAVGDVGEGAGQAVGDIGQGAGQAVGDVGQGAGQAVGDVGQGAGQAVGDVGQGAGQAAGNLDQLVGGVGQTVGQAGQGAGQALGGLGQGAGEGGQGGQALGGPGEGAGQALGQPGGNAQPQPDGQGQAGRPGAVAKQVAKMVAREIGHAASDEAKDLGLAATRKVRELGERREHRRAEKHNATEAAVRLADELGIDVADLEGTGSDGRVTVNDVRKAHEA